MYFVVVAQQAPDVIAHVGIIVRQKNAPSRSLHVRSLHGIRSKHMSLLRWPFRFRQPAKRLVDVCRSRYSGRTQDAFLAQLVRGQVRLSLWNRNDERASLSFYALDSHASMMQL